LWKIIRPVDEAWAWMAVKGLIVLNIFPAFGFTLLLLLILLLVGCLVVLEECRNRIPMPAQCLQMVRDNIKLSLLPFSVRMHVLRPVLELFRLLIQSGDQIVLAVLPLTFDGRVI